jgi:RimJ/RimL family protein N-acetyltransferase
MLEPLVTPRMILRPYRPDEGPLLHAWMADHRVIFWAKRTITPAESEAWLKEILALPDGLGWWAAFSRDGGERHLGHVGLQRLGKSADIEIAYHFHVEAWGQGLATEAAEAVLDHGFRGIRLARIVAIALPTNQRSLRVIAKLGLPFVGMREHHGIEHREFALTRAAYLTGAMA